MSIEISQLTRHISDKQDMSVSKLLNLIEKNKVVLPEFQRDYVWKIEDVRELLVSMISGRIIGSFLIWETSLNIPGRTIGDQTKTTGQNGEYLLDGQQRITSLYHALKGDKVKKVDFSLLYIDIEGETIDDLVVISKTQPPNLIAFKDIFDDESLEYYDLPPSGHRLMSQISTNITSFAINVFKITTDDIDEAIVQFNKLNNAGLKMKVEEIVLSKIYSPTFNLTKKLEELIEETASFKLEKLTLINTLSFWIRKDFLGKDLVALEVKDVEAIWKEYSKVVKKVVDYLQSIGFGELNSLPYKNIFVVLCRLFETEKITHPTSTQNQNMLRYILYTGFTRRYRVSSNKYARTDFFRLSECVNKVNHSEFYVKATNEYLMETGENLSSGDGFLKILSWLLITERPRSLKNNTLIKTNGNSYSSRYTKNLHHIFPLDYLKKKPGLHKYPANHIVNLCYVEAGVNQNEISNKAPSVYLTDFAKSNPDIKESCNSLLIHYDLAIKDDYDMFFEFRLNAIRAVIEEYFPEPKKF